MPSSGLSLRTEKSCAKHSYVYSETEKTSSIQPKLGPQKLDTAYAGMPSAKKPKAKSSGICMSALAQ
eukprot:6149778-Prorocentrum_lima.AAC.1